MKEPLNLRLSDSTDPQRGDKFGCVLNRRKASATDVLRGLVDAYIKSNGLIDAPWEIIEDGGGPPVKLPAKKIGR